MGHFKQKGESEAFQTKGQISENRVKIGCFKIMVNWTISIERVKLLINLKITRSKI